MARGRPRTVQDAIHAVALRHGGVVDVRKNREELERLAPGGDFVSAARRMRDAKVLHNLQQGRYLLNLDRTPSRFPRIQALDPLAGVVLGRLRIAYYLSWHSALWHHGLVDQQPSRLYAAVRTRKRNARVGRYQLRFVTVNERKFFGWEDEPSFQPPVQIATVEKAILDSFDLPRLAISVPVIANALRGTWRLDRLDPERLVDWALDFASPTLNRRLGFFMELYDIPGWEPLELRVGRGWAAPLAPGAKPAEPVPVNRRWRVFEDPAIVVPARSLR